jgi:hypothetical protein
MRETDDQFLERVAKPPKRDPVRDAEQRIRRILNDLEEEIGKRIDMVMTADHTWATALRISHGAIAGKGVGDQVRALIGATQIIRQRLDRMTQLRDDERRLALEREYGPMAE